MGVLMEDIFKNIYIHMWNSIIVLYYHALCTYIEHLDMFVCRTGFMSVLCVLKALAEVMWAPGCLGKNSPPTQLSMEP